MEKTDWEILQRIDNAIQQRLEQVGGHLVDEPSSKTLKKFEELDQKFEKQHQEVMDILRPIAETYNGVAFISKNMMKLIVTFSVISGLIWGWFAFARDWFKS